MGTETIFARMDGVEWKFCGLRGWVGIEVKLDGDG